MMIQSLSTGHEGCMCCLGAQHFNAIFYTLMLYLVVCWEVLCAYRNGLFAVCLVLLLLLVSLAGNVIVLCISSFSIKENLRLFFYVSGSQPMIAMQLRITVCTRDFDSLMFQSALLQNREGGKRVHHLQMKKLKGQGHSHDFSRGRKLINEEMI